jgi:MGT family glycosyltransferase
MARFLFTVWPFPGHFFPMIPVAATLADLGHETAFYTGREAIPVLETKGFRCYPFRNIDEELIKRLILSPEGIPGQARRPFRKKSMVKRWLVGTVPSQLEDLETVLSSCMPDVLICDPAMWAPILVLREKNALKLAIFSYMAASALPGPGIPPFGLGLPRPKNGYTSILNRIVRTLFELFTSDTPKAASKLRQEQGLPPLKTTVTRFAAESSLYLIPSIREFDFQRSDVEQSVHYVGPCPWNEPNGATSPPCLKELPSDRPLALVTEGTLHAQRPLLLQAAYEGLKDSDLLVIMTTGTGRDPEALGFSNPPPNIRVERFVPFDDILEHVDVLVTTGGSGTVLAALRAGVPLVVVPTAWDQPENARRVEDSGTGIRLSPRQCSPDRLRRAIQKVLHDPTFKQNAMRLSKKIRQHDGPKEAANLLIELSESGSGWTPGARQHQQAAP